MLYSYQDCWNRAAREAKKSGIKVAENDLIALCGTVPEKFWASFSRPFLPSVVYSQICHNLQKHLEEGYPVPYLTQQSFFAGLSFQVEEGVFIPQKDTEILVEKTLEMADNHWKNSENLSVLDLGTGCGNIAIALAKTKPHWKFVATDIEVKALQIARTNATTNQVKNVKFIFSNLFANLSETLKFNIIVSNPPYVSQSEYKNISETVKKQPFAAVVASQNGYFFYRQIFRQAQKFLTRKFLLIVEIGYQQKEEVLKLVIKYFPQARSQVFFDYSRQTRVVAVFSQKSFGGVVVCTSD